MPSQSFSQQPCFIWELALLSLNMLSVSESILSTVKCQMFNWQAHLPSTTVTTILVLASQLGRPTCGPQLSNFVLPVTNDWPSLLLSYSQYAENNGTPFLGVRRELMMNNSWNFPQRNQKIVNAQCNSCYYYISPLTLTLLSHTSWVLKGIPFLSFLSLEPKL